METRRGHYDLERAINKRVFVNVNFIIYIVTFSIWIIHDNLIFHNMMMMIVID